MKKGAPVDALQENACATSNNSTIFLTEIQAVQPPQPTQPITPEQAACLCELIISRIRGVPTHGVSAWLDLNGSTADGATPMCIHIGEVIFNISVSNWRPVLQVDALALAEQADAWLQAGCPLDDARACVEELKPSRTLLTDRRTKDLESIAEALESIAEANNGLSAAGLAMLDSICNPANWINPIPPTSTITGTWCAPLMKRRSK